MIVRHFWALAGAALLSLTGCEQPCPSQPSGCTQAATLHFTLEDGPPEAYEVRIRLTENGVEEDDRCLLVAPLPSDWPSGSFTATCAKNAVSLYVRPVVEADCDPHVTPTPDGIQAGASCETTVTRHELVLHRGGNPERIEIELTRSGVAFAPLTVTPQYADYYPDGAHCSAHCLAASETRSFAELTQPADS